jgi:signal transduction histidine kinase
VNPQFSAASSAPAIVQIQTISADAQQVRIQDGLRIPGGSQRITFGYAGLSLSLPERVRFRYQLEGFDHGWSVPVSSREVSYTNLGPREYRFRVIASNPDGEWNGSESTIAFQIAPLIWQTWWFRLAAVLAVAFAIATMYRLRLLQMTRSLNLRFEERLAERTRIAQELHDTLLQGFLSASMQLHVATDRLPEDSAVRPSMNRVLVLMGRVIEEGRNAVRGLRASDREAEDLTLVFARIQEETVGVAEHCDFRVVVEGEPRVLHPVIRDEVHRIGREALVNAFRHSRAKNIEIELTYVPNRFRMSVRDNGCGIDPSVLRSGRAGHWGLSGMRERAERIGAHFHVRSSATAGTEVELAVPGSIAFPGQAPKGLKRLLLRHYTRKNQPSNEIGGRK